MNENEFQKLMEASWRRRLTAPEEAALQHYFSTQPAARSFWEAEISLNRSLANLPDVPVSTNFTALVLQAATREAAISAPRRFRFNWLPRVAIASLLVAAGLVTTYEYRVAKRSQIARDIAAVSNAATFPHQWLQDFDAINRLSRPPVDEELLAALQ